MSVKMGSKSQSMGSGGETRPQQPERASPRAGWRSTPIRIGSFDIAINWRLAALLAVAVGLWVLVLAAFSVI